LLSEPQASAHTSSAVAAAKAKLQHFSSNPVLERTGFFVGWWRLFVASVDQTPAQGVRRRAIGRAEPLPPKETSWRFASMGKAGGTGVPPV
jgi:hypothetical protein